MAPIPATARLIIRGLLPARLATRLRLIRPGLMLEMHLIRGMNMLIRNSNPNLSDHVFTVGSALHSHMLSGTIALIDRETRVICR